MKTIVWSADETMTIKTGDGPARRFDPSTLQLSTDSRSMVATSDDRTSFSGLFSETVFSGRSEQLQPTASKILGTYAAGDGLYHALETTENLLEIRTPGGTVDLETVPAAWIEDATPAIDAEGNLYVVGEGVLHRVENETLVAAIPLLHHPRPIFDHSTGVLVGGFDDRNVMTLGHDLLGLAITNYLEDKLGQIESVTYASATGSLAMRVGRLDGRAEIWLQDAQGGIRGFTCPPALSEPEVVPAAAVVVADWGEPGRPLPVRRRILNSGSKGTVVIWDGGPGQSWSGGRASAFERLWLDRGFDTVLVDGSGSRGIELSRRLRDYGFDSILSDAERIAEQLANSPDVSGRVIVYGTSFGAVAAAETARRLQEQAPDRKPALLLSVPWLSYRHPSLYADDIGRGQLNADYAARGELARFGPMETADARGYGDRMAAWRSSFAFAGPTLVVFGEHDPLSRAEDIWPSAIPSPNVQRVVVPRANHRFTEASSTAKSAIAQWLATLDS